mgnify:CR=1 FL=1
MENNNICIICLDKTNNYFCKTSCAHIMCIDCLLSLMKMECPMCRKNLEPELSNKLKNIITHNKNIYENKINSNNNNQVNMFNPNDFPPLNSN